MNALRFVETKTGAITVSLNGRYLHSRVDPVREAERFVADLERERPRLALVVGPGLGYAFEAIRRLAPGTRTLGLPLCNGLDSRLVARADATWRSDRETVDRFLERELSDLDTASIAIVEWPPVVESEPRAAREVADALSAHVHRAQASLLTRGAFGRRWYRNRLHNYLNVAPFAPTPSPRRIAAIVVAGAGPGLERALPAIRAARERVELWATSSALIALSHAGTEPDVVVATDTALYGWEHLRPLIGETGGAIPVAATLAATRGLSACPRVAPLSENDPEDDALLAPERHGIPVVPPQGTVTTTACGLARRLTSAPIVVAGADFAWLAGRSHVRPHLSQIYRSCRSARTAPETTGLYHAVHAHTDLRGGWTCDRTLAVYARWFTRNAPERYHPLTVLAPSPALAGLPAIDESGLAALPRRHPGVDWHQLDWPDHESRRHTVSRRMGELRRLVRESEPPQTPQRFAFEHAALAHLAVSLALPELLRWYKPVPDSDRTAQARAWETVRAALLAEIASLEETFA
ncbi:MAG: 6-hydroxymethylpterin diphosphokinase MptE-like protein [Spirochaetota bacterium]